MERNLILRASRSMPFAALDTSRTSPLDGARSSCRRSTLLPPMEHAPPADGARSSRRRHPHLVGTLELSTAYTWSAARESLKVCTSKGIYRLSQMDELTFESVPSTILGIPIEKVHKYNRHIEYLYSRNNFNPILPDNQIYSQGYYGEIQSFTSSVEQGHSTVLTDITTLKPTCELLMDIGRCPSCPD